MKTVPATLSSGRQETQAFLSLAVPSPLTTLTSLTFASTARSPGRRKLISCIVVFSDLAAAAVLQLPGHIHSLAAFASAMAAIIWSPPTLLACAGLLSREILSYFRRKRVHDLLKCDEQL